MVRAPKALSRSQNALTRSEKAGDAVKQRVERVGLNALHKHEGLALSALVDEQLVELIAERVSEEIVAAPFALRLQHVVLRVLERVANHRMRL